MTNVANTFHFSHTAVTGDIIATNGPIVLRFEKITDRRFRFSETGSNVTKAWEHLPSVALAMGRWNRAQRKQ